MPELALHILDLVQNSISAGATQVEIRILIDPVRDEITIEIVDDGCGMSAAFLKHVDSPFTTTRTTRKVGLGIPLFKMCAEMTGGTFAITSAPGQGTHLTARFGLAHVDRPPLGDLAGTMKTLILGAPERPEFTFLYAAGADEFKLETSVIRQSVHPLALSEPDIIEWIGDYVSEGIAEVNRTAHITNI